jgi:hypothetical protein
MSILRETVEMSGSQKSAGFSYKFKNIPKRLHMNNLGEKAALKLKKRRNSLRFYLIVL